MALPDWPQYARRPSITVTWLRGDSTTPEDLTGATLTGLIQRGDTVSAITGTLTVTDAANGEFRWDLSAADVAQSGDFRVQFSAAFGSGQTPAKTFATRWVVKPSLVSD